jgi:hypothetical protein
MDIFCIVVKLEYLFHFLPNESELQLFGYRPPMWYGVRQENVVVNDSEIGPKTVDME